MWPSTLSCLNPLSSRPFAGGLVSVILLFNWRNTRLHPPPQLVAAGEHLTLQCALSHDVIVEGKLGGHLFPGTCREKKIDKGSAQLLSVIC